MRQRPLGTTGLSVSAVAFGAGPVPALLTKPRQEARQRGAIRAALDAGINWFDTAATYGDGESERHLGAALHSLGTAERVHVATKVRLDLARGEDIVEQVPREMRRGVQWVKPELVCEVEFLAWTRDNVLRHPSFEGLREDFDPPRAETDQRHG